MAPTTNKMHLYEHESSRANLVISILVLQYTFVRSIPKAFDILLSKKSLCDSGHFRCHNSSKVFDKGSIKLCHPIKYLNMLWIFGWWMFTIACIFFGFGNFLSLKTIKLKIILESTINAHFLDLN